MYFGLLQIVGPASIYIGLIPDLTNDHKIKGTLATLLGLNSQVYFAYARKIVGLLSFYLKHFLSEDELKHGIAEFMAGKLKNLPVICILKIIFCLWLHAGYSSKEPIDSNSTYCAIVYGNFILHFFGKMKQVTKMIFLVKEQDVSVIISL